MTVTVGINGFGRIGRCTLAHITEAARNDVQVVKINATGPIETNAHLLKYDSVHGRFKGDVNVQGDALIVNGKTINVTAIRNPAELPPKRLPSSQEDGDEPAADRVLAGPRRPREIGPKVVGEDRRQREDDALQGRETGGEFDGKAERVVCEHGIASLDAREGPPAPRGTERVWIWRQQRACYR